MKPVAGSSEQEQVVGLVRDAIVAAVDRVLERDHELEHSKAAYRTLGNIFLHTGLRLQKELDVNATELLDVAVYLQDRGQR